jgi:hypothetical protein
MPGGDDNLRNSPTADRELHLRRVSTADRRSVGCTIHATDDRSRRPGAAYPRRGRCPGTAQIISRWSQVAGRRSQGRVTRDFVTLVAGAFPRHDVRYDTPLRSRHQTRHFCRRFELIFHKNFTATP